jgi:hypothetical protein
VRNRFQGKKGKLCVYDLISEHEVKYHLFINENELSRLNIASQEEIWGFKVVNIYGKSH